MKMNEIYEAPVLEVLSVTVESGFAGSEVGENSGFGGSGETEFPE